MLIRKNEYIGTALIDFSTHAEEDAFSETLNDKQSVFGGSFGEGEGRLPIQKRCSGMAAPLGEYFL